MTWVRGEHSYLDVSIVALFRRPQNLIIIAKKILILRISGQGMDQSIYLRDIIHCFRSNCKTVSRSMCITA